MRAIVFDFDYTLADSAEGCIDCVGYAQERMGLPASGDEAIRRTIGLSIPDTLARLNGEQERHRAEEFGRLFLERADQVMADRTVVYEAVPEMLAALAERGLKCAIASTKYRYRIEAILEREGLSELVAVVIGAEDVPEHKPDPACLHAAVGRLGVGTEDALYVGDSLPDAEAAQRGGLAFVAVLTGTTPRQALEAHGPRAVLDSVAQLPAWLDTTHVVTEVADG